MCFKCVFKNHFVVGCQHVKVDLTLASLRELFEKALRDYGADHPGETVGQITLWGQITQVRLWGRSPR